MRRFRVFEPPGEFGRSEKAVFVRDGFTWWALLLPSLWFLRHRLFFWAIAVFLVDVLLRIATPTGSILSLLLGLAVALEGSSLRAKRLRRVGWRDAGAVWARDLCDAELLYFAGEASKAEWDDGPMVRTADRPSRLRPGLSLFDLRRA